MADPGLSNDTLVLARITDYVCRSAVVADESKSKSLGVATHTPLQLYVCWALGGNKNRWYDMILLVFFVTAPSPRPFTPRTSNAFLL